MFRLLLGVNCSEATGYDGVPGSVLKMAVAVLAPSLCQIFKLKLFKKSNICPLYKNGDAREPKNYRPVSLLPIVSRLLEKFVKVQITEYLQCRGLLPESQFAYRRDHSTEDALTLAVNRCLEGRRNNMVTGIAMLDLSKVFDRVRHSRLLSELFSVGIHGSPQKWVGSYLSDNLGNKE